MGITSSHIKLIGKALKHKHAKGGRVLSYSVPGIQGIYPEVTHLLAEEGYPTQRLSKDEIVLDSVTQFGTTIHVSTFFKMLGYGDVDTLDLFPDENPDIIADLNLPLPAELWNRYDLVLDSGTAEHCFNVKEVLGNAVRALKVGGLVMHTLPVSGWLGHGFYQFSPDLLVAFYGKNGFAEMDIKIELRIGLKTFYMDFDPEKPLPGDFWGIPALIFFVARKVRQMDEIVLPNQSIFDLPMDHPLRVERKRGALSRMGSRLLPDAMKKYMRRKQYFMGITLHPL